MSSNLIKNKPQFQFACYSLLHAFMDPPNVSTNTFSYSLIRYYYACISIVFMYSSVELFVKDIGKSLFEFLHGVSDRYNISSEYDFDNIFLFHKWSIKRKTYLKQPLNRVLEEIPYQARKRLKFLKGVSDTDIEKYAQIRKQFVKAKKLRDHLVHGTFHPTISDQEFEDVYVWKIQNSRIVLDFDKLPEKALDFYFMCISLLKYLTIVCFSGFEGNSKKNIIEAFNYWKLLHNTVPFEFEFPQQLIDLFDQKLANNP